MISKLNVYGTILACHSTIDYILSHELRTPGEEIAFTAQPKIHSHSQIFRYGLIIFCLPHRPKISDFFDICLHWVSVVRGRWDTFWRKIIKCHFHIASKVVIWHQSFKRSGKKVPFWQFFFEKPGWPFPVSFGPQKGIIASEKVFLFSIPMNT